VLLEGQPLWTLTGRYHGVSPQAVGYRLRRMLRACVDRPRRVECPSGPLILLADGLWFRFRGDPWVVYLMALKPRGRNRARFLDPLVLAGRETVQRWAQALATIPPPLRSQIRAVVSDDLQGMLALAAQCGWVLQLCHFHLISQLHVSRGRRKRSLADRRRRETLYRLTRRALDLPEGPTLTRPLTRLRRLAQQPLASRRMRMAVRQFLRRLDQFRAYRHHPELNLPTTTGAVEAMGHIIRHLMRRIRNVSTPEALRLWVTALIRTRPEVTCNGKDSQPNSFV
jgi:hypothetical protein